MPATYDVPGGWELNRFPYPTPVDANDRYSTPFSYRTASVALFHNQSRCRNIQHNPMTISAMIDVLVTKPPTVLMQRRSSTRSLRRRNVLRCRLLCG